MSLPPLWFPSDATAVCLLCLYICIYILNLTVYIVKSAIQINNRIFLSKMRVLSYYSLFFFAPWVIKTTTQFHGYTFFWFPSTSQEHASMWTDYTKLPLGLKPGVKVYVIGALQWTDIISNGVFLFCAHCSLYRHCILFILFVLYILLWFF